MVSLGNEQEEHIRQMLLNGDPGQPNDYQIFGAHRVLESKREAKKRKNPSSSVPIKSK